MCVTARPVRFTNSESECALRPSVIHRKVTSVQRSLWGADLFGAVRSAAVTGGLNGVSPFKAIAASLQGQKHLQSGLALNVGTYTSGRS